MTTSTVGLLLHSLHLTHRFSLFNRGVGGAEHGTSGSVTSSPIHPPTGKEKTCRILALLLKQLFGNKHVLIQVIHTGFLRNSGEKMLDVKSGGNCKSEGQETVYPGVMNDISRVALASVSRALRSGLSACSAADYSTKKNVNFFPLLYVGEESLKSKRFRRARLNTKQVKRKKA